MKTTKNKSVSILLLISTVFKNLKISHPDSLHAIIVQTYCKFVRKFSLYGSQFSFYTTMSITFHVNNGVQHYQCLQGVTCVYTTIPIIKQDSISLTSGFQRSCSEMTIKASDVR